MPRDPLAAVRLVATDLDGTLLRSDGRISMRTRRALERVEAAGIVIVFVTARPIRWVDDLREVVGAHGVVVCANGAVTLDVHRSQVLESRPIPLEAALTVVAVLRAAVPGIAFARESTDGFGREPGYRERDPAPPGSPIGPIEQLLDRRTVKLLARHEQLAPAELLRRATDAAGDRLQVTASSTTALAELSAPGVTKADALGRLCRAHDVPAAAVLAFGDMLNDLPMLTWSGTAVAVANAHPEVVAVADLVAPTNDQDGVAVVLERMLAARDAG